MKFSKVMYLLLIGATLAALALLTDFYKPSTVENKEVVVPLVKDKVDAKPIELNKPKVEISQNAETIKLEVIRVRPDGSLVIAGKAIPNSKIDIISGSEIIAKTTSDRIGDFVAVPEKQLESGDYLLSFRQTTSDGNVIIANKSVAINVSGNKNDTPIVAIIDDKGQSGAKLIQAPGFDNNKAEKKDEVNFKKESSETKIDANPHIAILALTYDSEIGQLALSGSAHNGVQVNAGFSGQDTSSTKILNDEWSLRIPGKLIAGKQKIFAVLLGKDGKVLSKSSLVISGKTIESADGKTLVIVQKGDALWNIAYQRLGLGKLYLDIVELNRDKIRNPDLIYPQQLFIIPNQSKN